ncbi:MAG: hypothetical protein ACOYT4_05410 [Nanoarchaeota archaeon]
MKFEIEQNANIPEKRRAILEKLIRKHELIERITKNNIDTFFSYCYGQKQYNKDTQYISGEREDKICYSLDENRESHKILEKYRIGTKFYGCYFISPKTKKEEFEKDLEKVICSLNKEISEYEKQLESSTNDDFLRKLKEELKDYELNHINFLKNELNQLREIAKEHFLTPYLDSNYPEHLIKKEAKIKEKDLSEKAWGNYKKENLSNSRFDILRFFKKFWKK